LTIKNIIHSLSFFNTLNEAEVDKLCAISSMQQYNDEYILHYENSQTDRLLFLVEGLAKASKIDKHNNEIFLFYVYKNHILSEISTLENDYLTSYSNMTLVENSQILSIDYKAFKQYFLNNGLLCLELTSEMIHRSKLLQDLVSREFVFNSVSKVAMMLSSDLDMFNRLKRYDISLMLHIQPATLSRVLNRLKRDATIDIDRGKVIILNSKRLENIYREQEDV
jgi:CRP/FNR family cyclic AMP-dependent transcriptional regulator